MVVFSSLLMAVGLTGLVRASPTPSTSEPVTVNNSKGFSPTIPDGTKKPPKLPPPPTIRQFTPEEFAVWSANATSTPTARSTSGSSAHEKRIIGVDERYYQASSAYPFGSMGRLYMPVQGGYAWCTGTLVGPRLMASARHCIDEDAQYFQFQPGYNNGEVFPSAFVTEIISLVPDSSTGLCDLKNDWALYVLSDALGNQRGYMPTGDYTADSSIVVNQPVLFNAGYPGDLSGGQQLYMTDSRTSSLRLSGQCDNGGPILADCDVAGGMSGGPLWRRAGDDRRTYGNLFGTVTYSDGSEFSVHSWGDQFIQGVNNLNAQYPS